MQKMGPHIFTRRLTYRGIALSRLGIGYGSLGLESIVSFIVSLILFIFPHFVGSVIMTLFSAIILSSGAVLVYAAILRFMRRDES